MSATSPLADLVRARGAVMRSYGGVDLAESFGDPRVEATEARKAAGLFDLSLRARLRFRGPDRVTFLHNLLSNDVASLRHGTGCYATLLTRESKVVADANLLCMEDAIDLELDRTVKDRAKAHLERFLVADDVEIEDRSEQETSLGIHGPRASEILRIALPDWDLPRGELEHRPAAIAGAPLLLVCDSWTGDPGFEIVTACTDAAGVWRAIATAGAAFGLRPAGMAAADILRLEAGRPRVGVDFDETHLVLEAGLERGIHFSKGCYLGQEIVERASARGHVNKRLVGLRIDGDRVPESGARLTAEGAEVGHITSAVFSPHLCSTIALGYVRRALAAPGSAVAVELGGASVAAVVTALPFYRGCEDMGEKN
jgi:folate-binding protein YgfZ